MHIKNSHKIVTHDGDLNNMSDNLPVPHFQTTLPIRLPERMAELDARFQNISKIADVADRVLALRSFREDIRQFLYEARGTRRELQGSKPGFIAGFGIAATAIVVSGIVAFPGGLIVGLGVGGVVGLFAGGAVQEVYQDKFENKSGDFAFYYNTSRAVEKMISDIVENADPRVVVMSPHADQAFDKFPRLRERFALAKDIDKMRSEITGQGSQPSLDKQRPEL